MVPPWVSARRYVPSPARFPRLLACLSVLVLLVGLSVAASATGQRPPPRPAPVQDAVAMADQVVEDPTGAPSALCLWLSLHTPAVVWSVACSALADHDDDRFPDVVDDGLCTADPEVGPLRTCGREDAPSKAVWGVLAREGPEAPSWD